ncbi:hypothetical protein TNCV_1578971 [Trichonephila clavipes]|nr:hypothetical protein TNCV_1578971 [Trichonephila clavipes]
MERRGLPEVRHLKLEAELIFREPVVLQLMKQDLEKLENACPRQFHFRRVERVTWCWRLRSAEVQMWRRMIAKEGWLKVIPNCKTIKNVKQYIKTHRIRMRDALNMESRKFELRIMWRLRANKLMGIDGFLVNAVPWRSQIGNYLEFADTCINYFFTTCRGHRDGRASRIVEGVQWMASFKD